MHISLYSSIKTLIKEASNLDTTIILGLGTKAWSIVFLIRELGERYATKLRIQRIQSHIQGAIS